MTATDKFFIVESKERVIGVEELGMEDNLDTVRGVVEE
jgi:hypothetical protein